MAWLLELKARILALFRGGAMDQERAEEMRYHLEEAARRNMDRGMPADEARRQALLSFGGIENVKEMCRDERGTRLFEDLMQDLRFGLRQLCKNPSFTAVAVLTLTIGIGANTAIFSVVNALLLNPFPFPHSDRIVWVEARHISGRNSGAGYREFLDWRSQNSSFDEMAVLGWDSAYTLTGRGEPQRITGTRTTEGFLRVLGMQTLMGRFYSANDDQQGAPQVAVLSYAAWQRLFGGRADVIGQAITLDGKPYTILGIMPQQFVFPGQRTCDFWEPLQEDPENSRGQHQYGVVARLRSGISVEQAQIDMTAIASRLEREFPATNTGWRVVVMTIAQTLAQDTKTPVTALFATVLSVLLIACVNVAGLLLARTMGRAREMALRAALGASRTRIMRQMLTESLMLAALAGGLGMLFAHWLLGIMRIAAPQEFGLDAALRVDSFVLGFTAVVSLLTGIGFGLAPAWYCAKADLNVSVKGGMNAWSGSRSRNRFLSILVTGEVALSLVLLVGAGLLIRDFRWILHLDTGVQSQHVLTFGVRLPGNRHGGTETITFYQDLLTRLRATGGIESAGAVFTLPMTGSYSGGSFEVEGRLKPASDMEMRAQYNAATPDYFRSMGIPILQGRDFDSRDTATASPVAIIDRTMAQQFFPNESPLGHRIKVDGWCTIIGVVGSVKHQQPMRPPRPQIYRPYAQGRGCAMWVTLRTAGDPAVLMAAARGTVHSLEKDALVQKLRPMTQVIADSLDRQQWIMWFISGFAGFALMLAAIGLYGVIAYSVSQRTQEIGVRMALGASRGDILGLVMGRSVLLACTGVIIGMPCAVAASHLIRSLLYGIGPHDLIVLVAVPVLLLAVALAASCIPARRAVRVDPIVALRQE
jgi:putative ABC transport system permease protein